MARHPRDRRARRRVARVPAPRRAQGASLDDVALEGMNPGSAAWLEEFGGASYVHPQPRRPVAGHLEGADLLVDGIALRDSREGEMVTVARGDDGLRLALVPTSAVELT